MADTPPVAAPADEPKKPDVPTIKARPVTYAQAGNFTTTNNAASVTLSWEGSDEDGDGKQDVVDVDLDRDGSPDLRARPVFVYGGRKYADLGEASPSLIPALPEVIKSKSEYDISAVTRPLNASIAWANKVATAGWASVPFALVIGFVVGCYWRTPASVVPVRAESTRVLESWLRGPQRESLLPDEVREAERAVADDKEGDQ